MRNHPSLADVIETRSDYEWLTVNISGVSIGDFVDSENDKGNISSPQLTLLSDASESDNGSVSYKNGVVEVTAINTDDLQNLKGEKPIGSINYYDTEYTGITINLNESIFSHIFSLLSGGTSGLSLKVAFPLLDDTEIKCLPLLKYQIVYRKNNEI